MRNRKREHLLLACVCAVALALAPSDRPQTRQSSPPPVNLDRAEISIEWRDPSCANCPEARITFRVGVAEFECLGGCAVPGRRTSRLSREQFASLMSALEKADFFSIPREVGGCIDCGITTITYRDEKRIHEVIDRGGARIPTLAALQTRLRDATKPFEMFTMPTRANYAALLDAGWKPNDTLDRNGWTMLNYAVLGGEPAAVELLLSHGATVNGPALESAYSVRILELLWKAGRVQANSAQARTLIWQAASNNWDENVDWLTAQGVDVSAPQPGTGITPLMAAFKAGYEESFSALLRNRARTDIRDANGRTVLMHTAESCALKYVRALLAAGADPALQDKSGKTARDLVAQGQVGNQAAHCDTVRSVLTR